MVERTDNKQAAERVKECNHRTRCPLGAADLAIGEQRREGAGADALTGTRLWRAAPLTPVQGWREPTQAPGLVSIRCAAIPGPVRLR